MIGRVNTGGGTGGTLTVNAPAGATVMVSKDGKTHTRVAGEDGIVVFRGLQSGTWTLTITDGVHTKSIPVDFITNYTVKINFMVTLFDNGDQCEDVTGGWTSTNYDTSFADLYGHTGTVGSAIILNCSHIKGKNHDYVIVGTVNEVDLSEYSQLTVILSSNNNTLGEDNARIVVSSSKTLSPSPEAWVPLANGELKKILDISNVSSGYIAVAWCSSTKWGGTDVSKIVDMTITKIVLS